MSKEDVLMKKSFLLVPFLSVSLLSSCTIFDLFQTTHKEAKADDLSSLKYAEMYTYKASTNDYVAESMLTGSKLPYRTIDDVPYITFANMLSMTFDKTITYSVNGDIYAYKIADCLGYDITISIDSDNDTVTINDYDVYTSALTNSTKVNNVSTIVSSDYYIDYSTCEYTAGNQTVFNLKDYSLDVIAYDSDVYIPFAVANELSFANMGINFVYNGDAFYYADYTAFYKPNGKTLSTYGRKYYNGSLGLKGRSSSLASFNYNSLCFTIDYFYGFRDKGLVPLDTYLTKNYRSLRASLLSTNNDTYQQALSTLFYGILYDGHTGLYGYSSIFGSGEFSVSPSMIADRYNEINESGQALTKLRSASLGPSPFIVRYSSKTAIVTFDSFQSTYSNFSSATIFNYKDSDSFAYFYYVFKMIKSNSSIENVVIDITLNGGGAVDGLIGALGFLTNDVRINLYNPLTSAKTNLGYAVDTNLDGKVNSNDVVSGYNIYILTSSYSFSCANLFASICKESKLATLIGETSGGGACVVRPSTTADGVTFQMSGTMRLSTVSNGTYTDIDNGVKPDYEFDRDNFYNDSKLASFVESL